MGHESLHDLFQPRPQGLSFQGTGKKTAWKRNWLFPLSHVTDMESRFYSATPAADFPYYTLFIPHFVYTLFIYCLRLNKAKIRKLVNS